MKTFKPKLLKANVTDLRNNGESPEAIKGAMETLPTMFDMEPHSPERLNKLLAEYKEYYGESLEDEKDKPGVSLTVYVAEENRDSLMDYLDQHWDEVDWNELRPVVEKDEVLSERYSKFVK
jgi:hypothetical protein